MNRTDFSAQAQPDAAAAGFDRVALARLNLALGRLVDAGRLPGAVWLVARQGTLAAFDCVGRLDPARDAAMGKDAIFRIYSMTKPIVSVAIMMLMEQGRLALADPVSRFLPEFDTVQVGVERDGRLDLVAPKRAMTIQDLLRHTSGLTYEFLAPSLVRMAYLEARIASRGFTSSAFSATLAGLPLMYEPGSVWDYGRSTDVLGRLIEVITGHRLGEHLRETVFDPLGMVDTAFRVSASAHSRIAEPFAVDPDGGQPVSLADVRTPPARDSGGGGLVSTAADYARFLALMERGGTLGGVRLLGRKTVELMTADHLGRIGVSGDLLPPGHGFGLGFAVRLETGIGAMPGSAGTYGWGGIAGTVFFVDPVERLIAVLMVQAPAQMAEVGALFRNLVYAALI